MPSSSPPQIEFLGIQAFLAVAECGSFGLAAQRLHLSQTAISHRMRKLEESLAAPLVVRTTRGVVLSDAGNSFLPRARAALQDLAASCEMVRTQASAGHRSVAFGCLPTLATSLLVPLLQHTREAEPDLSLRVFDSSHAEILELVETGTAAFGLTLQRPFGPGLQAEPVAREPFVVACAADHPLAGRTRLAWADLRGHALVRISLPSGNSMVLEEALGPLGDGLDWRLEAQRTAVALDMVRGGLGLTVVPRLSVRPGDGITTVTLEEPAVSRTLILVTRRGADLSPDARGVRAQALALLQGLLAQAA